MILFISRNTVQKISIGYFTLDSGEFPKKLAESFLNIILQKIRIFVLLKMHSCESVWGAIVNSCLFLTIQNLIAK